MIFNCFSLFQQPVKEKKKKKKKDKIKEEDAD